MPDLKSLLIYVLLATCAALGVTSCASTSLLKSTRTTLQLTRDALKTSSDRIRAQKVEAAAQLRTINASVLAQQKRIDAAHQAQEKIDAKNLATIADLRDRLRRERLQRAADGARRGDGGSGAPGAAGAGADGGTAGGAEAGGLLPAAPDREADEEADAFDADQLNEAYRSCRAALSSPESRAK